MTTACQPSVSPSLRPSRMTSGDVTNIAWTCYCRSAILRSRIAIRRYGGGTEGVGPNLKQRREVRKWLEFLLCRNYRTVPTVARS